jgi:hypothetical protein
MVALMTDSPPPAPDLFDEPRPRTERRSGGVSPLTRSSPLAEVHESLPLRWGAATLAGLASAGVALAMNFPFVPVVVAGCAVGALYLRTLPRLVKRVWLIAVSSFFFAQLTTIFINQPFTWIMRFGFCATLMIGWSYVRVNGDE